MSVILLKLVVWLLPRREWARAMLAEVAALDDRRTRRRFALGCVRAVLMHPASGLRIGAIAVVCAVPALLFSGPGGSGDRAGMAIAGLAIAICLVAVFHVQDLPSVACLAAAGGIVWWFGILTSETVRTHPQWALGVLLACPLAAVWRGGILAALGTAFATSLLVFVLAVGSYTALPQLAPTVSPANAADPVRENQIESTDPYVAELVLAALCGLVIIPAVRTRAPIVSELRS
jgi:hypothetical protein